jgi:hypothetical protein
MPAAAARRLARLGLPSGIGDEHVSRREEGEDAPDLHTWPEACQIADVGLVERGVGAGPGHQDPQRRQAPGWWYFFDCHWWHGEQYGGWASRPQP